MGTVHPRPDAPEAHRHVLYEHRSVAQILSGDVPAETAGAFFREHELVVCRRHMTPGHLDRVRSEEAVLLFGLVDCDACADDPNPDDSWKWFHGNPMGGAA